MKCALKSFTLRNPAPYASHARESSTVGLQQQTTSTIGILPAISCPPLPEKRPCSNRHQKRCKIELSEYRIVTTTEDNKCSTCSVKVRVEKCSHEMALLIFRASHLQTQNTAHNSHHCPKILENTTKHRTQFSPLSQTPRKCPEPQQKRQIDVKNRVKNTKHGKNENLMSKIDQKRVPMRRKV